MPAIISHKDWMKLTYGGKTNIRSRKLKDIDSAIQRYEKSGSADDMRLVKAALFSWIGEKGNGWKTSIRNKHNAVDTLYRQVTGVGGALVLDAGALGALQAEPRLIIQSLFKDASVSWKNEFKGKLNSDLVKPWSGGFAPYLAGKQVKTSAANNKFGIALNTGSAAVAVNTLAQSGGSGKVSEAISKCIAQIVPDGAKLEVLSVVKTLVPTFEAEFAAAVIPIAGLLTAAGGTLWNTGTALHKQYGISDTRMHRERSLAGIEADQAIEALLTILVRERNADVFSAGVSLTEFGGKLAGLALDGGTATNTAIGLAANITKLMNIVRIIYRDIKEKNAAGKAMSGEIDLTIFETCPLVGCYMICCAPTSVLMSLILEHFGSAGWMDKAERVQSRHILPLRTKARDVILSHRFEIATLRRCPGALKVNDDELKRMLVDNGKKRMVGFGSS